MFGGWKIAQIAPNKAGRCFVLTNQDLADILGRTALHSDNFHFWDFLDSRCPDSGISRFPDATLSAVNPW